MAVESASRRSDSANQLAPDSPRVAAKRRGKQTPTSSSAEFFAQFNADEADIRLIDPPVIGAAGRPAREQLDLPLRLILALAAGIGLVFLLHYLDDSVLDRDDLERMGLSVLGEIPRA